MTSICRGDKGALNGEDRPSLTHLSEGLDKGHAGMPNPIKPGTHTLQPKFSKTYKLLPKPDKSGQMQNIHYPPSSSMSAIGTGKKRQLRKKSRENESRPSSQADDSRRAELYNAARSQALLAANQIERKLQSQLGTFKKLSAQMYGGNSRQSQNVFD